jgi:hypothetical protein
MESRSRWLHDLTRRSEAARLLGLWVRIPPGAWMSVSCECCVLSGRGLCHGLILRPEESYRVCVCHWVWSGATITITRGQTKKHMMENYHNVNEFSCRTMPTLTLLSGKSGTRVALWSLVVTLCSIRLNIQKFQTLPTEWISVFLLISEETVIISLHKTDWFC